MFESERIDTVTAPPADHSDVPNDRQRVEVTAADLPLHCPMPGKRLWDSHPRVWLPIADSGRELCPYCGTLYVLVDAAASTDR